MSFADAAVELDRAQRLFEDHIKQVIEAKRDYVISFRQGNCVVTITFHGTAKQRKRHMMQHGVDSRFSKWAAAYFNARTGRWEVCGTDGKLRDKLSQQPRPRYI